MKSEDRIMHKLTKAPLALNGLGRCFITEKHLPTVNTIRRGLVSSEHGDDFRKNEVYDVIISGGGMVGSAMACSLGESYSLNVITLKIHFKVVLESILE